MKTQLNKSISQCVKKILTALAKYFSRHIYYIMSILFRLERRALTFILLPKRPETLSLLIEAAKQEDAFRIRVVTRGPGIRHYFYSMAALSTSAFIILDGHCSWLHGVTPRKGTIVVQAWHAGGLLKKMGVDLCPPGDRKLRKRILREHSSYTWVLTSAPAVKESYAAAFGKTPSQALALGLIRTDLHHSTRQKRQQLRAAFETKYPSIRDKKIVLYAPTFRTEETKKWQKKQDSKLLPLIDANAFMQCFSQHYILAFRAHYNNRNAYNLSETYLDASAWPLHEALTLADILITDYSSIFFDFLLFRKPIIFFPYDLEKYTDERGFYAPYHEFVPGPICYTQHEVFIELKKMMQHPTIHSNTDVLWDTYMGSCDGQVTKKILLFLKSQIKI